MNINIYIIYEELGKRAHSAFGLKKLRIVGVRLLSCSKKIDPMYLYIVDEYDLEIEKMTGIGIIYIGHKESNFFAKHDIQVIFVETCDKVELLFTVMAVFEKYLEWYGRVIQAITQNKPIQKIFDLVAENLKNPIALFDISSVFIMKTGFMPEVINSFTWNEVLSKGISLIENFSFSQIVEIEKSIIQSQEPFLMERNYGNASETLMIATLYKNGQPFATLGSTDLLVPFTKGQLSIVSMVKTLMELALSESGLSGSGLNISEGVGYYVDRLLQGFPIEDSTVSFYLNQLHWKMDDRYIIVYFMSKNRNPIENNVSQKYIFRIKMIIPDSYIVPYENGILAILHNSAYPLELGNEIDRIMQSNFLIAGVSLPFNKYINIKYAFIQAKTSLEAGAQKKDTKIYYFENYYAEALISALSTSTSIKSLCHPQILEIHGEKAKELLNTLYMYLLNGRNLTTTAKELHIHRNTLIYRIERINQTLGLDIDSCSSQAILILLMSCLIVLRDF